MTAKDMRNCRYCGWEPFGEWDMCNDFRVECSNPIHCKGWIRIYAKTRNRAIDCWNLAMGKDEKKKGD